MDMKQIYIEARHQTDRSSRRIPTTLIRSSLHLLGDMSQPVIEFCVCCAPRPLELGDSTFFERIANKKITHWPNLR